jgi:hypothetical protein
MEVNSPCFFRMTGAAIGFRGGVNSRKVRYELGERGGLARRQFAFGRCGDDRGEGVAGVGRLFQCRHVQRRWPAPAGLPLTPGARPFRFAELCCSLAVYSVIAQAPVASVHQAFGRFGRRPDPRRNAG